MLGEEGGRGWGRGAGERGGGGCGVIHKIKLSWTKQHLVRQALGQGTESMTMSYPSWIFTYLTTDGMSV